MILLKKSIFISMCVLLSVSIFMPHLLNAQTHSSISLDNQVYYILEQAEIRGMISPLPGTRPYTHSVVITRINEILEAGETKRLSNTEREILNLYLERFAKPKAGFDLRRGTFGLQANVGKNEVPLSMNVGLTADIEGSISAGADNFYYGFEIWPGAYVNGDLGRFFSYDIKIKAGLMRVPRLELGEYNTYYDGFAAGGGYTPDEYRNDVIKVYSEPLTHFPYSHRKKWDGSVFHLSNLSSFVDWPESLAGGYSLPAEITASFLDDKLILRLGRITREWGSASFGSSLALNQSARPFLAFEAEFNPVPWFSISTMTGGLEYYNQEGIKISSGVFQNMFSVTMLQFRIKNYLVFEFIDGVVYPKRFEIGYIAPIVSNFFFQNNIGDFDNLAMTLSLKGQIPGIASLWISFFIDEMDLTEDMLTLDRQMLSLQAGLNFPLPFLSFTSLKISYTRINPYCYTHNRNFNPWYSDRMETHYVNNGVGLGYYLPPNSDELLVKFETMPIRTITTSLQYQMIRHGANYGSSAVDGSNLRSELDPHDRNNNAVLKRFFLRDGAYQWNHIIKAGIEWSLTKAPITLYTEAGVVISYFTNINGRANSGTISDYARINTPEYPESTAAIVKLGVKVYPQW
ncbi:MAG: hypothetical protein FWB73_01810 [Treponema sp.]|nr:hypothetical protein [Treponema sp.]